VSVSGNFLRIVSGIFLAIFCHFLPFSTELSTELSAYRFLRRCASSWDSKNKKTRFILRLPQLTRMALTEFKDMDRLLQAAVPWMASPPPLPSKVDVKRQKAELVVDLAETQAELAETRQSLDAQVGF